MKKYIILTIGLLAACTLKAQSSSITYAWTPSASGGITNYVVGMGPSHTNYTILQNAGLSTTYTVNGLSQGVVYYAAVKAVDTNGLSSVWSNEVTNGIPTIPPSPTGFHTILIQP